MARQVLAIYLAESQRRRTGASALHGRRGQRLRCVGEFEGTELRGGHSLDTIPRGGTKAQPRSPVNYSQ